MKIALLVSQIKFTLQKGKITFQHPIQKKEGWGVRGLAAFKVAANRSIVKPPD